MSLDAHVYCRCIQDKKTTQHPFPELLVFSPVDGPSLEDTANFHQYRAHDDWFRDSCEHHGHAASEHLGNIAAIAFVRERLEMAEQLGERVFPVLLNQVVYNGVHAADYVDASHVKKLAEEVESAKALSFDDAKDKKFFDEFMNKMSRLCQASLETGYPIVF